MSRHGQDFACAPGIDECNGQVTTSTDSRVEFAFMPLYESAFGVAVVLFAALAFMQVMMRQQVHHARFGNQEIGPSDVRFSRL